MDDHETIGELLARRGVSRRALLKYTSYLASLLALPPMASRRWPRRSPRRGVSR